MKLEEQVVSLELAKKLKSLNVKQDSLFYWVRYHDYKINDYVWGVFYQYDDSDKVNEQVSAFTVAELFDYLYTEKGELWIYHNAGKYLVQGFHSEANEENLADCLAKILITNLNI